MKLVIMLNGTHTNPFLQYGLTMNPFPAIPRVEYAAANAAIARLAAEPIADCAHIRRILQPVVDGAAGEELIIKCCSEFKPGKIAVFEVTFPDDDM